MSHRKQIAGGCGLHDEPAEEFFAKTGPLPASFDEIRRHPRFYYRACATVIIHPLGKQQSKSAECFVLTRDLSRSGMSLHHTAQLFPGQRLDISLNAEPPRPLEVVWCQRLAAKSYVIGCRFLKKEDEAKTDQPN